MAGISAIQAIALAKAFGGGGSSAIGDFTKYEKKKLTFPNAEDTSSWDTGAIVPCTFEPKLVFCYRTDDSTAGKIVSGVFAFTINENTLDCGGVRVRNGSGALANYGYYANQNASAGRFKYSDGTFYACRASSGIVWSNTDEYTFEIYG